MKRLTTEEFIEKAKNAHGDKYDYSKVIYKGKREKIKIICPIHGEFVQLAGNHMRGQGCPKCGKLYASTWQQNNFQHFIKESTKRFGNKFEFPKIISEYVNSHSKITLICKECGNVFTKIACDHITSVNGGCIKCNCQTSNAEQSLGIFIQKILSNNKTILFNDRTILKGKEIDILIPDLKIGIEYNGLFWHTENRKGKTVHLEKLEMCKNNGYNLIQIFEDEYVNHKEIVEHKLIHLLNKDINQPKIPARKCVIKNITKKESETFLNKYHIQGFVSSTKYYGAYYQEQLIGVMTFKISNNSTNDWELTRFASDYNYTCQGVGGKLFKHFIREMQPDIVKSFADRRWTINETNNLYIKLGFKFDRYTLPDYHYMISSKGNRYHKFGFRKKTLLKKYPNKLNENMTEKEMCEKINAYRIYDCGLIKYIWKK